MKIHSSQTAIFQANSKQYAAPEGKTTAVLTNVGWGLCHLQATTLIAQTFVGHALIEGTGGSGCKMTHTQLIETTEKELIKWPVLSISTAFIPNLRDCNWIKGKSTKKYGQSTLFIISFLRKCYKNLRYLDNFGTMPLRKYLAKLWLFQNIHKLKFFNLTAYCWKKTDSSKAKAPAISSDQPYFISCLAT